jgi:hypothetical protein
MKGLSAKPDFEEAKKRWMHFWRGELTGRPLVMAAFPRASARPGGDPYGDHYNEHYYNAVNGLWEKQFRNIQAWLDNYEFAGEFMPCFAPDLGPDQWAAFFGAELKFSPNSRHTNWVDPIIGDWSKSLPLVFNEDNPTFRKLLKYIGAMAADAEGKYLVEPLDSHSNADTLSALRGATNFCMDLYDCPDEVERAMMDVRKAYKPVWDAVYQAGRMGGERGCCKYGLWHERDFAVVQCDMICLIGKEHFRKYVLPALEEEISYHESTYFHLDGVGALQHLDDILAIPKLGVLQWQPGAGQKANFLWLDILKKAQRAGKSVIVFGNGETNLDLDAIKSIHKELDPAKTIYAYLQVKTRAEYETAVQWLERNT